MLLIPAICESFRSLKDKTLKITFETNEPTGEQLVQLSNMNGKFGFLVFKEDALKQQELKALETLKSDFDDGKTKSQRLRAVLYVSWEQNKLGYEVFDDYYNFQMERLITHYKNKLDDE